MLLQHLRHWIKNKTTHLAFGESGHDDITNSYSSSIICNQSVGICLRNESGECHPEVMIMISVTNIMLMFTDSNSIQTPILHHSEVSCIKPIVWGDTDIQSRRMAAYRFEREARCRKHHFPMATHVAVWLPLDIYIVNTCLLSCQLHTSL